MKNFDDLSTNLSDWLNGMVLVSMVYAAGFSLRFEREQFSKDQPSVLRFIVRSSARFGSHDEWSKFVCSLPLDIRRGDSGDPALAYRLMLALGAKMCNIELSQDGSLGLTTSDGEFIFVAGMEEVWEESWVLEELEEVAGPDARSFICDASGEVRYE